MSAGVCSETKTSPPVVREIPRVAALTSEVLLSRTEEIEKVREPVPPLVDVVPPVAMKAVEVSGLVTVVVMFDPPATVTDGLTKSVINL